MFGGVGLFLFFAFLPHFKRFKGLGFEGELREEIEQAAKLRRGLQALAEQLGESVAWQMAAFGSWGGGEFQEKRAIVDRTAGILKDIGISPAKIDELNRAWHKMVMTELARPVAKCLRSILHKKMEVIMARNIDSERMPHDQVSLQSNYHSIDRARARLSGLWIRDDYENVPSSLRAFIEESPWLTPDDRQAIYRDCVEEFLDIDQYARERTIRRPDILK